MPTGGGASFNSNPLTPEERLRQAEKLLGQIASHVGELSEWEKGFVSDMEAKVGYVAITDKMLYKLRDIAERMG